MITDKNTLRAKTKEIKIGDRVIGGGNPILIQSMTNTKTEDVEATVAQILRLEAAGCEIIRCTVPTVEAAKAIGEIKKQIHIPLVADIHFDYKMAIAAMENGADKIRINPGNIGSMDKVKAVVDVAKERNIPIRVGVNSGSLEKQLVEKYNGVTAEGIVESALDKVRMIEELGYDNLVISIKSSDVLMCVKAHELLADKTVYPLHVGITESGTVQSGNIKSAIGLGLILHQGIGDTIRVSLTGDPVEEIKSAKLILRTLGLRKGGIEVLQPSHRGGIFTQNIGIGSAVGDHRQDSFAILLARGALIGEFTRFLKSLREIGLVLLIVSPLSFLADIVTIFLCATFGGFDVSAEEPLMDGGEHNGVAEMDVNMGVGSSLLADLVTTTPIQTTGKRSAGVTDNLVCEAVIQRVVDGELILATCFFSWHKCSFRLVVNHLLSVIIQLVFTGVVPTIHFQIILDDSLWMCVHRTCKMQRVILTFASQMPSRAEAAADGIFLLAE